MSRLILNTQAMMFLAYGLASGAAFSLVLDYREQQARMHEAAVILLHLPIEALTEYRI